MSDVLIRLEGVGRTFRSGEIEVHALRQADLHIRRGDYLSIVGPSGSGKSTLLNVIALLDRHTAGTYRFEGTDVTKLSEGARTGLRAHRMGFRIPGVPPLGPPDGNGERHPVHAVQQRATQGAEGPAPKPRSNASN